MKNRAVLIYLSIYITLNISGGIIASNYWWTDGLNLSFQKKETLVLLLSAGIIWIGILYLTIFLIRKFFIKALYGFIGPIDLVSNEYYKKELGEKTAQKFQQSMMLSFPIFIVTLLLFVISMNFWKSYQLNNFGENEVVTVEEIKKDIKEFPYVYIRYNSGKSTTLLRDYGNLKVGDKVHIVYSTQNPNIVQYKNK